MGQLVTKVLVSVSRLIQFFFSILPSYIFLLIFEPCLKHDQAISDPWNIFHTPFTLSLRIAAVHIKRPACLSLSRPTTRGRRRRQQLPPPTKLTPGRSLWTSPQTHLPGACLRNLGGVSSCVCNMIHFSTQERG